MTKMNVLILHCCDKIPEGKNSVKEEKFILAPGFRNISLWLAGCTAVKPVMRQKRGERGKLLTSQQPGSKENEIRSWGKRSMKVIGPWQPLENSAPLLILSSLPGMPSYYDLIPEALLCWS